MPIPNITFTNEKFQNYYSEFFVGDLRRFFYVETTDKGIEYIKNRNYEYHSPVIRHKPTPAAAFFSKKKVNDIKKTDTLPDGNQEDELMFIGLLSAIFICQRKLASRFIRDNKKFSEFFQTLNIPLICDAIRGNGDLDKFLAEHYLKYYWKDPQDAPRYKKMIEIAFPFMTDIIAKEFRNWNNHEFEDKKGYLSSPANIFEHDMERALFEIKRMCSPQFGLMNVHFTPFMFKKYMKEMYMEQFKKYFPSSENMGSYPRILALYYSNHNRLVDGNPGNTIMENFMFSVATLSYIFAEQCIELYAKDSQELFHRASGWPLIYQGPGPGFLPHGLIMLKAAGLAPTYEESLFYIEAMASAKQYMSESFESIINGTILSDHNKLEMDQLQKSLENKNKKKIKKQFKEFFSQTRSILMELIAIRLEQKSESPEMPSLYDLIEKHYGGSSITDFCFDKH